MNRRTAFPETPDSPTGHAACEAREPRPEAPGAGRTDRKPFLVTSLLAVVWGVITAMGAPGMSVTARIGFGVAQGLVWTLVVRLLRGRLRRLRDHSVRAPEIGAMAAALGAAALFAPGLYTALTYLTPESYLGLMLSEDPGAAYLYFMVLNPLMELVLVPLALYLNWPWPHRRNTALAGALTYYAIRTWTAFYFAPVANGWSDSAGQPPTKAQLAEADLWLTLDWPRIALDLVVCLVFAVTTLRRRGQRRAAGAIGGGDATAAPTVPATATATATARRSRDEAPSSPSTPASSSPSPSPGAEPGVRG